MDIIFGGDNLFRDFDQGEDRRIYRIPVRNAVNTWDDFDFFRRFRLSKPTFYYVLQLVVDELQPPEPR